MNQINDYFTTIYYYLHPENQGAISHQAVRILQLIQKEQCVTVQDVAKKLHISQNTASEHIKKLEKNHWIVKKRSIQDQRVVHIHLTDEGLQIVKRNTELDEVKLRKVLKELNETQQQEIKQAFKLLSEVAKNVYND